VSWSSAIIISRKYSASLVAAPVRRWRSTSVDGGVAGLLRVKLDNELMPSQLSHLCPGANPLARHASERLHVEGMERMRCPARRVNKRALIVEDSDITLPAEALHHVTHGADFLSGIGRARSSRVSRLISQIGASGVLSQRDKLAFKKINSLSIRRGSAEAASSGLQKHFNDLGQCPLFGVGFGLQSFA
jgi:hypothetical protein